MVIAQKGINLGYGQACANSVLLSDSGLITTASPHVRLALKDYGLYLTSKPYTNTGRVVR